MFSDFGLAKALSARISTRARTLHWADNRFIILLRFAILEVRSNLGREPPYEVTASALPQAGGICICVLWYLPKGPDCVTCPPIGTAEIRAAEDATVCSSSPEITVQWRAAPRQPLVTNETVLPCAGARTAWY